MLVAFRVRGCTLSLQELAKQLLALESRFSVAMAALQTRRKSPGR